MNNCLLEKEIEKAEESVKICKLNIDNQNKRLLESIKKAALTQSKLTSINLLLPDDREELMNTDTQLKYQTNLHEGLILEFQGVLDFYENKLQSLKSDSIYEDL